MPAKEADLFELNLMLFHLCNEEKYVLEDNKIYNGKPEVIPSFRILYKGKLFIENGGYVWKHNMTIVNRFLKISSLALTTIATLIAGIYGGFEIWKYYYGNVPLSTAIKYFIPGFLKSSSSFLVMK